MDTGVATCPISFQIQPKWLRLGLGSSELDNLSFFPSSHAGRLSFPRRWKHLCLRGEGTYHSPMDEKPYEILPGGRISYLDEQDIVAFVDPPTELIPLEPESYNPAAYLWKKLEDIPEERRHRLLASLKPKHIPKIWELTGTRYQDAKLAKKIASALLSMNVNSTPPEYWRCRTSKGPMPFSWLNDFKKDEPKYMKHAGLRLGLAKFFSTCKECDTSGEALSNIVLLHVGVFPLETLLKKRVLPWKKLAVEMGIPLLLCRTNSSCHVIMEALLSRNLILVSKLYGPLYFTVREVTEIISTEQPCDLVYDFGDGLLGLSEFPEGFPIPAKHPWPFNDHLVIYIRHAGPGVVVGQAWQEGMIWNKCPRSSVVKY